MSVVLSLLAALSWGASDFLGGFAGRRSPVDRTIAITFASQFAGLVVVLLVVPFTGSYALTGRELAISLLAGAIGSIAIALLYRGLSTGRMGLVAPVAGAVGAAIPVVVGVVTGERPGLLAWLGVVAGVLAIILVSREVPDSEELVRARRTRGRGRPAGLWEGVGAGVGFGLFFVLFDQAGSTDGLWQLVPLRVGGIATFAVVGLAARQPFRPAAGTWLPVIGVGVLDLAANGTYLLATRTGLLALVVVLSSLYPVGTVLLARAVLGERLERHQVAGLGLAVAAVVLIALA